MDETNKVLDATNPHRGWVFKILADNTQGTKSRRGHPMTLTPTQQSVIESLLPPESSSKAFKDGYLAVVGQFDAKGQARMAEKLENGCPKLGWAKIDQSRKTIPMYTLRQMVSINQALVSP